MSLTFPKNILLILLLVTVSLQAKSFKVAFLKGKSNVTLREVITNKRELVLDPKSYVLLIDTVYSSYIEVYNSLAVKKNYSFDSLTKVADGNLCDPRFMKLALASIRYFKLSDQPKLKLAHNPAMYRCPISIFTFAPPKCTLYSNTIFLQWRHETVPYAEFNVEVSTLFNDKLISTKTKENNISLTVDIPKGESCFIKVRRVDFPNEDCQDDVVMVRVNSEEKVRLEKLFKDNCHGVGPFSKIVEILICNDNKLFMDANMAWQKLLALKILENDLEIYKQWLVSYKVLKRWESKEVEINELDLLLKSE